MRYLLTTQSQNCYREQIKKEMLTRLAWKRRYADLYPSCNEHPRTRTGKTQLPHLPAEERTPEKMSDPPPPPPPVVPSEEEQRLSAPPLMRPVSPKSRNTLYQDSSHHGKGRRLYLQRRGQIKPEERFDFPVLSSWEYGWRLGDYTLNYKTPSRAKFSVVKNTFYARNGVFSSPTATDMLG
ncbi:protein ATP6V1FNB-like [Xyrichtys novacula]|uniref:Protein ATP6V1FNB-like n=1 Tax=Xyrichtys novacula TaxID=13765 RepID=A0AAV1EU03_XYRNO|nr:protein ATP6V1FNB-like [Xyrichtys novacula]